MKGDMAVETYPLTCTSEEPEARTGVGSSSVNHWMAAEYAMLMKNRAMIANVTCGIPTQNDRLLQTPTFILLCRHV